MASKKKKNYRLSEETISWLDDIRKALGLYNETAALEAAIKLAHDQLQPGIKRTDDARSEPSEHEA